jgi:hypothetical protein
VTVGQLVVEHYRDRVVLLLELFLQASDLVLGDL